MLSDAEKEEHRMKALQADHWQRWYEWKAQDADYMDERELWLKRASHYRLECQLHLSVLEAEMENV